MVADNDCTAALRALGEPTRVRIVGLLLEKALGVGEISERLGVSPYNVSKHVRVLREAGLLVMEKNGRQHLCALAPGLQGRAPEPTVLDLGCCRFQFDGAPPRRAPSRRPKRR